MKRLIRKLNWALVIAVLLISVWAIPTLAVSFIAYITLTNNSAVTYNSTPFILSMDNEWIAANGYCASSMLDVRITDSSGNVLPMMPADDKTLFVAPSIPANAISSLIWSSGNSSLTSHDIIVGYGGYITVADNSSLELSNNFAITITDAYFHTSSAYVDSNILYKQDAFRIYVVSAGNIRAAITHAGDAEDVVVTKAVTDGEHDLVISADATNLSITVDGGAATTAALGGNSVPDNANSWVLGSDAMPYAGVFELAN